MPAGDVETFHQDGSWHNRIEARATCSAPIPPARRPSPPAVTRRAAARSNISSTTSTGRSANATPTVTTRATSRADRPRPSDTGAERYRGGQPRRRLARAANSSSTRTTSLACQMRLRRPSVICVRIPASTNRSMAICALAPVTDKAAAADRLSITGWRNSTSTSRCTAESRRAVTRDRHSSRTASRSATRVRPLATAANDASTIECTIGPRSPAR